MEQVEGSATSERGGLTSEEKIASLFQPDTLLSDQYFENLRRKTCFEPEKRLMLAVLEDAIRYYQDNFCPCLRDIGAQSRIPAPGLAPVEAKKTKSASSDRRRAANQARGLSVRRESSPGQKRSISHR